MNDANTYWTLEDLKTIASESGNDNPSIFLLSEKDECTDDAFSPIDIFLDDGGDVIIKFDEGFYVGFK